MYNFTTCESPIGLLTLACDGDSLVGLWIENQKYYGGTILGAAARKDDMPVFGAAKKWLDRYFAGDKPSISELPLAPIGSEFRREVWGILCEIPYGEVTTYGRIAKKIAAAHGAHNQTYMPSRAVGGAVGHNPVSIIIPCHRVIGSDGSLTGYAGGVAAKKKLLEIEGIDLRNIR